MKKKVLNYEIAFSHRILGDFIKTKFVNVEKDEGDIYFRICEDDLFFLCRSAMEGVGIPYGKFEIELVEEKEDDES